MYHNYYHLKTDPFRLSPDHRFCYGHRSYRRARHYMDYALDRGEGFVVVTGAPGTGKSTLIEDLFAGLRGQPVVKAKLASTQLEADDLLRMVAFSFSVGAEGVDKATVLHRLTQSLGKQRSAGRKALLVVDEAQDLPAGALEELRLLTNLQEDTHPLLQIFLVGQPGLRDMIRDKSLEQLHQRIVAACHLEPLGLEETQAYVEHRLSRAGWEGDPCVTDAAFHIIQQFSDGIPRRINLICSRLFLHGSVEELHQLRTRDVRSVLQELHEEDLCALDDVTQEIIDLLVDIPLDVRDDCVPNVQLAPPPKTPPAPIPLKIENEEGERPELPEPAAAPVAEAEPDVPKLHVPGAAATSTESNVPADDRAAEAESDTAAPRPTQQRRVKRARRVAAAALVISLFGVGFYAVDVQPIPRMRAFVAEQFAQGTEKLNALRGRDANKSRSEVRDAKGPRVPESSQRPPPRTPANSVSANRNDAPARSAGVPQGNEPTAQAESAAQERRDVAPVQGGADTVKEDEGSNLRESRTDRETRNAERSEGPQEKELYGPVRYDRVVTEDVGVPAPTDASFPALEEKLRRIPLNVVRMEDGSLRINLRSAVPFANNSAEIDPASIDVLDKLAGALASHDNIELRVVGHASQGGAEEYNIDLSRRRAEAVANSLRERSNEQIKLSVEGRGSSEPVVPHDSADRKLNRRTVVYISTVDEG